MNVRKVAVFDVDGTIFRSSLLIELLNQLINSSVLPKETAGKFQASYKAWLDRTGSYDEYLESIIKTFYSNIETIPYTVLEAHSQEVATSHAHEVYRYTRDLVKELKEKDYYLLAISGSPKIVTDEFCKTLGFDKVYGRLFEVNKETDSFTGKVLDEELIGNKDQILKRAVEKESLSLEDSVGVGDTEADIPFLEMVTTPICFNPNQALHDHAKEKDWPIVVERKDVIYKL